MTVNYDQFLKDQAILNRAYDDTAKAFKNVAVDSNGNVLDQPGATNYLTKVDEASSTVTYVGKADIGTATSADSWQIKKISTSSTVTTVAYAGGVDTFSQVWDNRTSLSYS